MVRGDVPRLPIELTVVPSNYGFVLHRDNEFMFLMLGETVGPSRARLGFGLAERRVWEG